MFTGDAPSLNILRIAYGDKDAEFWLNMYLADIAMFKGYGNQVSVEQIKSLMQEIFGTYGYLKITEFMLFCQMFKASRFRDKDGNDMTRMYGMFALDRIMDCLGRFAAYRQSELERIERTEEVQKLLLERANTISYAEFQQIINKGRK